MCTVTWLRDEDGYVLVSNRDEGRDRLRARPPEVEDVAGVRVLTPRDADAGGTWVAVNEFGTTVCLLNRQGVQPKGEMVSRGLLVRDLASATDVADVRRRLPAKDLGVYRPFTLIALDPRTDLLFWWDDGERLVVEESPRPPLASSSHRTWKEVVSARRALWDEMRPADLDDLMDFHASHLPERGVRSPCMHRLLASTVSVTQVRVGPRQIEMCYTDGPPCKASAGEPHMLSRRG